MLADPPTREYDILDQVIEEPPILYHYTDAAGFLGIVTSGRLRLSNARFLNDQTEQQYGWRIINEVLDEQIALADHLSGFFQVVKRITDPAELLCDLFVCSLSEHADSLSQWQRYGADGQGYSIAFSVRELLGSPAFEHVFIRRLIYSLSDQQQAVRNTLQAFRERMEQCYPESQEEAGMIMRLERAHLVLHLSELALIFKNPHFSDEAEWRLILLVNLANDAMRERIQFSQRGAVIKPHIDLGGGGADQPCLPLVSVLCGPRLDAGLGQSTAHYFLRQRGYEHAEARRSELAVSWR